MNSVICQSKGTVSGSRQMTDIRAGFFFFDFLQSFLYFFLKATVLEVVCALYGDCTS